MVFCTTFIKSCKIKSLAIMPTNWNAIIPTINIIKQYKEHSHIYIGNKPQTLFYWT
jgi:hypothetical protein